jgi:Putative transposase
MILKSNIQVSRPIRQKIKWGDGGPKKAKNFCGGAARQRMVVYCKRPFAGPAEVLRYLARYTHRVAISNRRLVALDDAKCKLE